MIVRRWLIGMIVSVTGTLLLFSGIMHYLDPLLRYGAESAPLTFYSYSEMYSNPGIARNYEYDSVMVGTSMIENTDIDLCDELLKTNMVRLPYSGGTSYNMTTILDICFESGNDIKSVYWELDEFQLTNSATEPRYPLPTYLYESSHKNDLSYLLNLDIFYHYTLKDIIGTLQGQTQSAERRGIELYGDYGKEAMLSTYSRPEITKVPYEYEGSSMQKKLLANMDNITSEIEAHPETEFNIFMVPFSILYWDNELRNGRFDATMECLKYTLGVLVTYDNVNVYFYQGDEEIMTNLDNYKDYSHYGNWINDKITLYISEGKNRVTEDNYEQYVNELSDFVHSYDFESIFE